MNQRKPVRGFFDAWEQSLKVLVRLGGNYTAGSVVPINVGGIPAFTLTRNTDTGWLQLSFELQNRHGQTIAKMENNDFLVTPENVHDLHTTVTKHQLKIWIASEEVGLDLAFRWLSWNQFCKNLEKDRKRGKAEASRDSSRWESIVASLPEEIAEQMRESRSDSKVVLPEEVMESLQTLMVDRRIPLLDIREMAIYRNGVKTTVRKGIAYGKSELSGNIVITAGQTAFNLPAYTTAKFDSCSCYAFGNGLPVDDIPEASIKDQVFRNRVIVVDRKSFFKCRFENCDIVYKGGQIPECSGCHFQDCLWVFDEAARNTIEWLHHLHHGYGEIGHKVVEQMFRHVGNSQPESISTNAPSTG